MKTARQAAADNADKLFAELRDKTRAFLQQVAASSDEADRLRAAISRQSARISKAEDELATATYLKRRNVGSHFYPGCSDGADVYTSNCEYGCGCWMSGSRSGSEETAGAVTTDPHGECPNNPKLRDEYEETKQALCRRLSTSPAEASLIRSLKASESRVATLTAEHRGVYELCEHLRVELTSLASSKTITVQNDTDSIERTRALVERIVAVVLPPF